jgi:hypothetical protein
MQNELQDVDSNRPIYSPIKLSKESFYQLFIGEIMSDKLNKLYESCTKYDKKNLCIASETKDILTELQSFFSTAPLSSVVYIDGSEPFIWKTAKVLKDMGLVDEQLIMLKPESNLRDLFCVHCFTITRGVTHTPAVCSHCHRDLCVTEHFSKLHSAYMGYQVNAEDLNDIPETKELT